MKTLTRILALFAVPAALAWAGPVTVGCGSQIARVGALTNIPIPATGVSTLKWSMSPVIPGLSLEPSTGILSGIPSQAGHYVVNFAVSDSDTPPGSAGISCGYTILPPGPVPSCATLPAPRIDVPYSGQLSPASDGIAVYSWTLLSGNVPGLALSADGRLTGTPAALGDFPITVSVSDALTARDLALNGTPLPATTCTISVVTPLYTDCVGFPSLTLGTAVNASVPARGGTPPYVFRYAGRSIPGVSVASDGSVTGTPTTPGIYPFQLLVSDAGTGGRAQQVDLVCSAPVAPRTMTVSCNRLPPSEAGKLYVATLAAAGGVAPYRWSLDSIPVRWFSIDPVTGAIQGTPPMNLPFPFTVRVEDSATPPQRQSVTAACQINPLTPPVNPVATCGNLPVATLGVDYSGTLAAQGGTAPYLWRFDSLSYVPGLKLASDGTLSGRPSIAGTFPFFAQVIDAAGRTDLVQCSTVVQPVAPPALEVTGNAEAATSVPVRVTLDQAAVAAVEGSLTLSFRPDAEGSSAAPVFGDGAKAWPFAIAAGARSAREAAIRTGTVAGELTVSLSRFQSGGVDATPETAVARTVRIPRGVPALVAGSARIEAEDGRFVVQVAGYSTTRELAEADVTFRFVDGATETVRVDLRETAAAWFASEEGRAGGGEFELALPFERTSAPVSATVIFRNNEGASGAVCAR